MRAVVQPGLVNLHLSTAAAPHGLYFVPDPSSQKACTIGGNVAENSGGPHTLAYGVTTNHVTGLELVLSDGSVVRLGGKAVEYEGYDLIGAFVGSEGTLGIVTEITVRLTPLPEDKRTILAAFPTIDGASETVSAIIGAGIVPSAIELMDQRATARRAHRERLPRRRRQPPSPHPVREGERARGREAGRSRDPRGVRRGGRVDHRRARRRYGEELLHAPAVHRRRSRDDGTREVRVRSGRSRESRKDLSHSGTVPRVPARREAMTDRIRPADAAACAHAVAQSAAASRSLRASGAGTKDYLGEVLPADA